MNYSRYNIFSKIKESDNYFIVNLLTGNADILDARDAEKLIAVKNGSDMNEPAFMDELKEKGYFISEEEEKKLYRRKYLDFLDSREDDEVQLFFVLNYSCNFACSYCYQDEYVKPAPRMTDEKNDYRFFFQLYSDKFHQP